MKLEENLVRLRKEHGLSQNDLAEKLNVSRQAVSRWEQGAAMPSTDNLIYLSKLYGITLDELIYGREKNEIELVQEHQSEIETVLVTTPGTHSGKWSVKKLFIVVLCAVLIGILLYTIPNLVCNESVTSIKDLERDKIEITSIESALGEW